MITGFGNNVVSALAADITASQTTIQVMPGAGEAFARLLTYDYQNASNDLRVYAKITLTDAGETEFEVCHLTAVNNDLLTVVREQEGTTAKGWSLNDVVANFATRGSENQFVQIEHLQSGHYTSGVAGGTANALTLDLPASYFLNGSTSWELRTPLVVYPVANNTGPATLQLTMGGRPLGTFKLYKGNKAELTANDILKDVGLVCVLDKTKAFFNVSNPGAIYAGLGTAAFKDIVTSPTDTTAGRVLTVGYHGLGSVAPRTAVATSNNYDNIPTGLTSGFWTHAVSGGPYAYTFTLFQDGGAKTQSRHLIIPSDPNGKIAFRWDGATATDSKDYQYFFTDKNKPSATDCDAVSATNGGTFQKNIAVKGNGATISIYPLAEGQASYLLGKALDGSNVFYVGRGSAAYNVALYNYKANNGLNLNEDGSIALNLANGKTFTLNGQVIPASYANFDARYMGKADAYTKTESDGRYIQNIQLGAERSQGTHDALATSKAPAGHVLNGIKSNYNDGNWEVDTIYFKPIQKYINGTWVTITG